MPTGYTSIIYDGKPVTFEEFVMRCARAMCPLVTMREEPLDAPIPERFEPGSYHPERIKEAKDELARISTLTPDEAQQEAEKEYKNRVEHLVHEKTKCGEIAYRYETMLEQIKEWKAPADHYHLKKFMLDQLSDSIKHDGNSDYYERELEKLKPESGEDWRARRIKKLWKDIDYCTKEYAEEVERVAWRNKWLAELRESLKGQHE